MREILINSQLISERTFAVIVKRVFQFVVANYGLDLKNEKKEKEMWNTLFREKLKTNIVVETPKSCTTSAR